jgi:hypothetical protein
MSLESDIRAQLAPGEASKLFQSEMDGIWFNDVHCNSTGRISMGSQASRADQDHIDHTHTILSSPLRKELTPPAWYRTPGLYGQTKQMPLRIPQNLPLNL